MLVLGKTYFSVYLKHNQTRYYKQSRERVKLSKDTMSLRTPACDSYLAVGFPVSVKTWEFVTAGETGAGDEGVDWVVRAGLT